jgi:hypothetical protein
MRVNFPPIIIYAIVDYKNKKYNNENLTENSTEFYFILQTWSDTENKPVGCDTQNTACTSTNRSPGKVQVT